MKKIYVSIATLIFAFTLQAQSTGQMMDFSLQFIGYNADSQAEIALIATPDFTQTNGNSADIGAVISVSGGAAIVPGNSAFVNDASGFPPVNEYAIPANEWDISLMSAESTASGNNVYQILRTPGTTNVFFDAIAGQPIIIAVFKVYDGMALAPPTSGDIVLIKNSDPLLAGNTAGNSNFLNINFPGLAGGTIDLYPGDPMPGDDGFTPAFSPISFSTLSTTEAELTGISIYPNPATDVVTIKGLENELSKVEVYNILGKKVMTSTSNLETINVSEFQAGVYFAKLYTETANTTIKFIKK